ncbi:hypothetical protein MBANPS3_003131 [Mucor bainieri]
MSMANNDLSKRDDQEANASSSTSTSSKKSLTYTLPTMYTPMPSATVTEDAAAPTEDPGQYHLTLFTPTETSPSNADGSDTTQKTVDPYASLPTEYSVLVSKAPNEVTRTTKSWTMTTATTTASASASATPSVIPVKSYSGLNKGQLAGVIVGSIAGGLIAIYLFYVICWSRRKALRKAKEEKELRDREKKTNRVSTIHLDYDSDEDEEKAHMHHDDNQPVSLPRSQPQYDPTRVYCSTSRSDPKQDFRSYYRTSPGNTSNSSSVSGGSNTPLNVHNNLQPFYGGFSPYYGPMLQHQPPAFVSHPNHSMPLYALHQQQPYTTAAPPTTMPVTGNASGAWNYPPPFDPTVTGIYQQQPQQTSHSHQGSIASRGSSERCGSTISSVLMPDVAKDEDIQSASPSESIVAAVLDPVEQDDVATTTTATTTQQEQPPTTSDTTEGIVERSMSSI